MLRVFILDNCRLENAILRADSMNKMINQSDHTEALFDNLVLTSLKKQRETRELPIVKSPLRYPGGKSRAVPMIINNYIRK